MAWGLPALAEDLGQMRVQRMDGSWITGQVEDVGDSYRIKMGTGITVTLPKNQVKALVPIEQPGTGESAEADQAEATGPISDKDIEALLEGINVDTTAVVEGSTPIPDQLPTNEESVQEMMRLAGADKKLETPHFVMVYTAKDEEARRLARRLEAVWRWNIKYFRLLDVPVTVPEYKLEIYFFGTYDEFETHSVNTSGRPTGGALGYFQPVSNRSHFFEMVTYPPAEARLKLAEDKSLPLAVRQRHRNIVRRWAEGMNMEVVQHEVGHHIHFNLGLFPYQTMVDAALERESDDPFPRWLVEGTTMMFEVPPTTAGASLGVINHGRLDEFRRRHANRPFTPEFLKRFVVDNGVWFSGYYYPEGWALVYYLRKNFKDGFAKYMQMMTEREPGDEVNFNKWEKEFEDCFGKIDKEWVEKFYAYMYSLPLKKSLLAPELDEP